MPIVRDMDGVPRKKAAPAALPPDEQSLFGPTLVDALRRPDRESKQREYVRPSDALHCARRISYVHAGVDGAPMDASGVWITSLGTTIHEIAQRALYERFGDDVECEIPLHTFDGEGHAVPTVYDVEGTQVPVVSYVDYHIHSLGVVGDIKSVGGFKYKMAIGERSAPQGPDRAHIIQAAIGALLRGAPFAQVAYIAKEAISQALARSKGLDEMQRFVSEWTFPMDDELTVAARNELRRQWGINRLVHDDGLLAARIVPELGTAIQSPRDGGWQITEPQMDDAPPIVLQTGRYWGCGYCPYQERCIADGPGRPPVVAKTDPLALSEEDLS